MTLYDNRLAEVDRKVGKTVVDLRRRWLSLCCGLDVQLHVDGRTSSVSDGLHRTAINAWHDDNDAFFETGPIPRS